MDTRFYQSPDLNIERLARDLEETFLIQGYQVQHLGNSERMIVQLKKGGSLETLIGMSAALTLTIQRSAGGVMAMVSEQEWIDKAAAGALGILFLWPLAVTAGAGVLRQAVLEGQLLSTLDTLVMRQRADVKIGPLPPEMQAQMQRQAPPTGNPASASPQSATGPRPGPGQIQCLNCQEINEAEDFYCSHCGKPLSLHKRLCPQCKAEVKANAAFCTKCGTSLAADA
ncbi:zinc ribbon domain-containing protein [Ktedonosporobacter rubrisoli]|uniref:Zinc ribbon domain-containing protein n=1 Tax=Ktedonosporobacter rubrisoli TaxID=2509675 RepID=A0A4P6JTW7_KTERU|nr:zinc ribbon domain-containing protein [Ktedonosporobacter rubrisoli]QBD78785.1 zinc ribbon domain-containing protein [Ktedonosporobacter rubrisoli]